MERIINSAALAVFTVIGAALCYLRHLNHEARLAPIVFTLSACVVVIAARRRIGKQTAKQGAKAK